MKLDEKQDLIEIFQPNDFSQIELRRGFGVARPVPRHWHEEYQFCLIQSGAGELIYRGSSLPTPPASLFIVHPGEIHSNNAFDAFGCSYRTIFLAPEMMHIAAAEIDKKVRAFPFFPTAVLFDEEIIRQYLELHFVFEQPSSNLEKHTFLLNFLVNLISRFAENSFNRRAFKRERKAVNLAREYISECLAENISLEKLAAIANLSPFHFNRVFAEEFGMPPHALQTHLRVLKAKNLLRQGTPISQVAAATGFADQSHLNRHFKRLTGVTPGKYLQNSKNVQDSRIEIN